MSARRGRLAGLGLGLALLGLALWVGWTDRLPPSAPSTSPAQSTAQPAAERLARGAYVARLGNCAACHTAPGGTPLAGGRAIATPFGSVVAGNLTPDPATGLGRWNADDFWRALHHGRSRDGRRLSPAFPYAEFSHIARDDADALFDWLRAQPAAPQPAAPPGAGLRWPFGSQPALALWRALFFRPAPTLAQAPAMAATAERGAYLVRGLGHCASCHAPRNRLGATLDAAALAGGLMPMGDWQAPALACGAGDGDSPAAQARLLGLLKTGTSARDSVAGPMAEVVLRSTQHWHDEDLRALVLHLARLGPCPPPRPSPPAAPQDQRELGQRLYGRLCADCHGAQGEGRPGAYPALAGNRSVNLPSALNLVQLLRHGGFAPSTAGHPQPHGMPPQLLGDAEIAAVASFVRQSWGNRASAVDWIEVSPMAR